MDRYEEFQRLAKEKFDAGLIEKEREIAEAKETYMKLKKEYEVAYEEFKKLDYAKTSFIRESENYAIELHKAALKEEYMPRETVEVFEKFYEVARRKTDHIDYIGDELDELLEFYRSVEKIKNV